MAALGNAVEVELAVSSVVGSGLFICSISLAAVILVSPVEVKDRIAFVRRCPSHSENCMHAAGHERRSGRTRLHWLRMVKCRHRL